MLHNIYTKGGVPSLRRKRIKLTSASQHRNPCSGPYLFTGIGVRVMFGLKKKNAIVDLPIRLQLNLGNSLSPMGDKDKDLGAASQTVLIGVRLGLQGRLKQRLICRTPNGSRAPREKYLDIWGRKQSQSSSSPVGSNVYMEDELTMRRSVKTSLIRKWVTSHPFTVKLTKQWTPEILMECCCVARN